MAGAVCLAFGAGAPLAGQAAQVTAFKQALAETLFQDEGIAAFYRARDFAPIWTGDSDDDRARRAALLAAFETVGHHGLPTARYDAQALMARFAAARDARARGALEMELSQLYLRLARDLQTGVLDPRAAAPGIKREVPLRDAGDLLQRIAAEEPAKVLRSLPPQSPEYARLMKHKLLLERALEHGGWGPEVRAGKLEPGQTGEAVITLRDRLVSMKYLRPTISARYDAAMETAVRAFQEDHGLEPDGVAGAGTLKEINKSVADRLKSVIVAMERERWINLPEGLGQRHILVNLTDFKARIIDDGKVTFETRSVVGHQDPDRRTPEFSDEMDHMVINPSWYVPRSIIVKEYLPLLRQNPGAAGHLQITDRRGRVVNRGQGFANFSAANFPYSMRQPPGPRNALGTVKFMFPNKHNIYLHDTPAKSLFAREVRTYSHGCVRLNDPHDFAYMILARQTDDPEGFFHERLRSGQETRVDLDQPIPVHLIYRTAITQAKGKVNYRRDVYGRDARIWAALNAAGVVLNGSGS
ncbi:L,D-transpeptidase family protein [Aestuariicoccus sp. MJ-SS9]|uniref:L,D-transpeptidase family protein n=1 Tax=Aestuariicoccus sp. MJ-SS9 TaxID=3079855 RepID=UPI003977ACE1